MCQNQTLCNGSGTTGMSMGPASGTGAWCWQTKQSRVDLSHKQPFCKTFFTRKAKCLMDWHIKQIISIPQNTVIISIRNDINNTEHLQEPPKQCLQPHTERNDINTYPTPTHSANIRGDDHCRIIKVIFK